MIASPSGYIRGASLLKAKRGDEGCLVAASDQSLDCASRLHWRDSPHSAADIAHRIIESVELLTKQPHIGRPGRIIGTRELVVAGTPYLIPYRVRQGRLELLAVMHGRQKWPERLGALSADAARPNLRRRQSASSLQRDSSIWRSAVAGQASKHGPPPGHNSTAPQTRKRPMSCRGLEFEEPPRDAGR
ncbi:MAG: type II toxin-antitoxin system RelE/ParE family toxin [Acidobacteriota bacterium]